MYHEIHYRGIELYDICMYCIRPTVDKLSGTLEPVAATRMRMCEEGEGPSLGPAPLDFCFSASKDSDVIEVTGEG
jgi:hypothetical protein